MPIKYIGRTHYFKGKTLWEIVGNLRNFGVGRIVVRTRFERYPEPSYMKILKVETLPNPEEVTVDNLRKVRVWVERIFRGVKHPQPVVIESASYKTDYRLIPKDEEEAYCRTSEVQTKKTITVPKSIDFPPLLRELIIRDMIAKGEKVTKEPKLELVYNKLSHKLKYEIVEDASKAEVKIGNNITPDTSVLYHDIKV